MTIAPSTETLESELFSSCISALKGAEIAEEVYCVVLAWSPGQHYSFPPILGVGLVSERAQVVSAGGSDMPWTLWNPAEFENYDTEELELGGALLDSSCESLNEEMNAASDWSRGTAILNAVAKRLCEHDWQGTLAVSEDFVAYATDYELSECTRNMRVAAPERVQTFADRGWLIPESS